MTRSAFFTTSPCWSSPLLCAGALYPREACIDTSAARSPLACSTEFARGTSRTAAVVFLTAAQARRLPPLGAWPASAPERRRPGDGEGCRARIQQARASSSACARSGPSALHCRSQTADAATELLFSLAASSSCSSQSSLWRLFRSSSTQSSLASACGPDLSPAAPAPSASPPPPAPPPPSRSSSNAGCSGSSPLSSPRCSRRGAGRKPDPSPVCLVASHFLRCFPQHAFALVCHSVTVRLTCAWRVVPSRVPATPPQDLNFAKYVAVHVRLTATRNGYAGPLTKRVTAAVHWAVRSARRRPPVSCIDQLR